MLVDLNQVRAADYAKAGFFQAGEMPRPGIDGYYALAMSRRLKEAGISPQEFVQFCERLANQLEPGYDDAGVSAATRAALRTAGAQWKERCAALAELFDLASGLISSGKSLAALIMHLERVGTQLALLSALTSERA